MVKSMDCTQIHCREINSQCTPASVWCLKFFLNGKVNYLYTIFEFINHWSHDKIEKSKRQNRRTRFIQQNIIVWRQLIRILAKAFHRFIPIPMFSNRMPQNICVDCYKMNANILLVLFNLLAFVKLRRKKTLRPKIYKTIT